MSKRRPASEDLTEAPRVGGREINKTATRKTKQDTFDLITFDVSQCPAGVTAWCPGAN